LVGGEVLQFMCHARVYVEADSMYHKVSWLPQIP